MTMVMRRLLATTTQLNTPGTKLATMSGVHAMTDVTGFGLAGHLLEICRGSQVAASINFNDLPILKIARDFAEAGILTGARTATGRATMKSALREDFPAWQRHLLTDPQTRWIIGACSPDSVQAVLAEFHQQGFADARVIGELLEGAAELRVD